VKRSRPVVVGKRTPPEISLKCHNSRTDPFTYLTNGTPYSSNIIGAIVGEGWCYGSVGNGSYYGTANPQFLLRLAITNLNGTNLNIVTDATWSCSTNGPIRHAAIYDGENYDATREGATTNWSTPSYLPLYFTSAVTAVSVDASNLFSQPNDPIRIAEYRPSVNIWTNTRTEDQQFVTIFDMGQVINGWCTLSILNTNGAYGAGSNIVVRHAEVLQLDANNYGANGPNRTNIYTANLGVPTPQVDTYTLNSNTNQQFQPHFTKGGFFRKHH